MIQAQLSHSHNSSRWLKKSFPRKLHKIALFRAREIDYFDEDDLAGRLVKENLSFLSQAVSSKG